MTPRLWVNVPRQRDKEQVIKQTLPELTADIIGAINSEIQTARHQGLSLVYKTDSITHVLDFQESYSYKLHRSNLADVRVLGFTQVETDVSKSLNANLSQDGYLAFFKMLKDETTVTLRFYPKDHQTIPMIYVVSKNTPAKLLLASNPYIANSLISLQRTA